MTHKTKLPTTSRPPTTSRWQFSLGTILFVMTVVSLILGLWRAIPMSSTMREAFLWLGGVWCCMLLFVLGPPWLRFSRLRSRARAAREAECRELMKRVREGRSDDSAPPAA